MFHREKAPTRSADVRESDRRNCSGLQLMTRSDRHNQSLSCPSSSLSLEIMSPATTESSTQKDSLPSSDNIEWSPASWRQKKAKQQPVYADTLKHQKALDKLETLPLLVTAPEVSLPTIPSLLIPGPSIERGIEESGFESEV